MGPSRPSIALWLASNTKLTHQQIGEFCGLEPGDIDGLADRPWPRRITKAIDPTFANRKGSTAPELTAEEIARCETDPEARLQKNSRRYELARPSERTQQEGKDFWAEGDGWRIQKLRELWPDLSISAKEIGLVIGCSKNSALSKGHRIGLGPRDPIAEPKPPPKPKTAEFPGATKCAWPIGHPREAGFHFCGARALQGRPYCASHCAKAYIPNKKPLASNATAA